MNEREANDFQKQPDAPGPASVEDELIQATRESLRTSGKPISISRRTDGYRTATTTTCRPARNRTGCPSKLQSHVRWMRANSSP